MRPEARGQLDEVGSPQVDPADHSRRRGGWLPGISSGLVCEPQSCRTAAVEGQHVASEHVVLLKFTTPQPDWSSMGEDDLQIQAAVEVEGVGGIA